MIEIICLSEWHILKVCDDVSSWDFDSLILMVLR